MARKPPKLKVRLSPRALNALDEIWEWNARTYDPEHARTYIDFLHDKTNDLATEYPTGKVVSTRPEFHYITIKRRAKGHGHVALFEIINGEVYVLNFYHTAQDWQGKLARGEW